MARVEYLENNEYKKIIMMTKRVLRHFKHL